MAALDMLRDRAAAARYDAANELIQAINHLREAAQAGLATKVHTDRLHAAEQRWDRLTRRVPS